MPIDDKVSMFFGAKPDLFEKASLLRENMTESEALLWSHLKDIKSFGVKFRRQHPLVIFILDFYCHPARLAIEVDGAYHFGKDQREYDLGREGELARLGIKTIRFTNEEVTKNLNSVVQKIREEVNLRLKS